MLLGVSHTFSGNGISFNPADFSSASSSTLSSSCLIRLDAAGDEGSSSALRLPPGQMR